MTTKTRDISDLLDANGDVKASALDNVPDSTNASALSSGTVAPARLGSGTASSTTFLAGDSTFKTISGTTINNNANNRLITGSDSANTLEGEANLIFDGSNLGIGASPSQAKLHVIKSDSGALNNNNSNCLMIEDSSAAGMSIGSSNSGEGHIYFGDSDDADVGGLSYFHSDNSLRVRVNASERMRIHSNGVISANNGIALGVGTANTASNVLDDYEEGTADVKLRVEGRGDSSVAGTRSSSYTKIGNRVFVRFYMNITSTTGNDSFRQMQIFNLPFNLANLYSTTAYASLGGLEANADKHFQVMLDNNSNTGQIQEWDGIQGDNFADHFDTSTVYLEMSYQTA